MSTTTMIKLRKWVADHNDKIIITVAILSCVAILLFSNFGKQERIVEYDCRDAHWHPDVPNRIKKACQELFQQERQKEQDAKKYHLTLS